MKFRERIGKIWKKKSTRYGVAGTLCLAVAGLIFALNMGSEAQAETINIGNQTFTSNESGVYEISTSEQLLALSDETIESGNSFKLTQDIEAEIIDLATGTFGGTFDGNGHIITITTPAEGLASKGTTGASEGLLFGTVTGTVANLIVEIPSDIKYTRNSKVGINENSFDEEIKAVEEAKAPYDGTEKFSKYSLDADTRKLATELKQSGVKEKIDGIEYNKVSVEESVIKTTAYKMNDTQTDQFGIICGTLDSNAVIDRVYVKGNENIVLNVIQNADPISNTKTQSGTRNRYFYYEESTGSYTTEVTPSSASVNAPAIQVYNGNKKQTENSENSIISAAISAPYYVESDEAVTYNVTITNKHSADITITGIDESNSSGDWKHAGGTAAVNWSEETLMPGAHKTYEYTISGGINNANFTVNYQYVEQKTEYTVVAITSTVVNTGSVNGSSSGSSMDLTLKPKQQNYLANGSTQVLYELTIANNITGDNVSAVDLTIDASGIAFKLNNATQSISWTQNGNPFTSAEISNGGSITLEGALTLQSGDDSTQYSASVTVTPAKQENTYENVTYYQYKDNLTITEADNSIDWKEEAWGTEKVTKGNHLNAGIIAGTSKGSITQIKQDMLINGSSYDGNTAELNVGGIIGKEGENAIASNLYILGTQNYAGENSALPTDSIVEGGTKPNNTNWTSYNKYESTGEASESFDLAWLIKAEKESSTESENVEYFTYSNPVDGLITVGIPVDKRITAKDLSYTVAYNARKSLDDASEDEIYVDNNMELGQSGYYRHINSYATDGYYHYTTPAVDLNAANFVYPYIEGFSLYNMSANVTRTNNPLNDKVEISFTNGTAVVSDLNGKIYYEINSTVIPTSESDEVNISSGIANIPFEISPSYYQITPVIGGYIYPTETTDSFNNRAPLPAPIVTCFDYYNASGAKNSYKVFKTNEKYEAGIDMLITPSDDENNVADYTLRYKFTEHLLDSDKWNSTTNEYIGSDKIMSDALEYIDAAVIPENMAGKKLYLYVEVSKKNYTPAIYYYGPFDVTNKTKLVDSLNGTLVGDEDGEVDNRVLDGDVVTLAVSPENENASGIQYMVSTVPTTSYTWTDYTEDGITLSEKNGEYIYARIEYDENKYSEPQLFDYIFGSACGSPIITPNTGLSTSGEGAAATIEPTTLIGLSSRTADATVFYVKSNPDDPTQSMAINMERTTTPTNSSSDGTIEGEYKYFVVNNRWYRTKNTRVEKYTSGLNLSHSEDEPTYMYITAVALADGYDSSDELTFIYKVKPPQQVKAPEAAFETRFTPGGEEIETATVSKGGKLSFYSVTPGATLYYAIGTEGEEWEEIPEDGVSVEGNYGGNYVVRVQAKKYTTNDASEQVETMLPSEIITFVYKIAEQELANAPTATPGTSADVPTTVIPGNKILLSTTTKGASIFFTTDGTTPQVEFVDVKSEDGTTSKKYQPVKDTTTEEYDSSEGIVMPSDGKDYFTITAIAVKEGLGNSPEARFTYIYPDAVLAPYANIDSGKVELNTQVLLKNLTEGAVIYYNVAYGADVKEENVEDPTLSSTVFNEEYPFTITQKTIIKAMAAKDGVKSIVATFTYDPMAQLAAPTASIETGSVVSNGTVLQLSAAKGATIYYTIDGSDPTDAENTAVMSGNSVTLNGEPGGQMTIKAFAKAADNSRSEVATFTYQFSQNTMGGVTANIATGSTVSNGTKIILMSDVTGADIYYTTDGDSPIEHGTKGTTVEVNGTPGTSFTIKAVAKVNGEPGIVSTFIYKIKDKPDGPTASPAGGTLTVATRVSLDSSEEKIYYTTDGTEPTKSSNLYSEPILINRTTTLKAIAVSEDGEVSDVATFQYTAAPRAGMPKADQENGQVLEPGTKIKLWSDTSNAVIYYTTDGTDPTVDNLDSLLVYDSDGIEINRSVTIKAAASLDGMQLSKVSTWNYIVEIIPAVEMKKEEAEKLAEEGLQDTNIENLERKNEKEEAEGYKRVLKEKECNTMVISSKENIADNAVLYTEEKEINPMAVRNAKTVFGNDYTILSEYEVRLKSGKSFVQPKGEVDVVIPIPDGYENATLTVVTVNSDNKLTTLETRRENGMLYASTTSVKDFAVVGLASPEENSRTFPYLLLLEITAGAALLIGIGYYAMEKWKKYKKYKKRK